MRPQEATCRVSDVAASAHAVRRHSRTAHPLPPGRYRRHARRVPARVPPDQPPVAPPDAPPQRRAATPASPRTTGVSAPPTSPTPASAAGCWPATWCGSWTPWGWSPRTSSATTGAASSASRWWPTTLSGSDRSPCSTRCAPSGTPGPSTATGSRPPGLAEAFFAEPPRCVHRGALRRARRCGPARRAGLALAGSRRHPAPAHAGSTTRRSTTTARPSPTPPPRCGDPVLPLRTALPLDG